jgi:hypothetical protein
MVKLSLDKERKTKPEVMNMKEKNTANRWKWALLLGGGLAAAAVLWGCFNPVLSVPKADGNPDGKPAGNTGPASYTVTVVVEGSTEASASRALAGPSAANIRDDGIRNIMQLIVVDGAGNIASFSEARKESGDPELTASVMAGGTYHFLLLQGHDSDSGGPTPPTLLAAGFMSLSIKSGTNKGDIIMRPLVADTAFVPAAPGWKKVEAKTGETSYLTEGGWKLNWTMDSTGASDGTWATVIDPLLAARKAVAPSDGNPGYAAQKRVLDGAASEPAELSVTGNVVSLSMNFAPGDAVTLSDAAKYVNFNLEYVPFNLRKPADDAPNPWAGINGGNEPVWIIRNGLNDLAQTGTTDYSDVDGSGKNGNGAVKYKVLALTNDEDDDGIPAGDEIKWGLDPSVKNDGDSDGDLFSDKMEMDNGFDPGDVDDNPAKAIHSSLTVSNGKPPETLTSENAEISFITGGYTGTANGYYAVTAKGVGAPPYYDYKPFPAALGLGSHTPTVSLPNDPTGAWKDNWDVYVLIMKDRNVSLPERIPLPGVGSVSTDGGGWY